jgi:uncharacterized protein (DUF488 family)
VLWTIGHSSLSLDALIERLRAHAILLLVDVRTVPRSRANPQFNRDTLPDELERVEIGYRHEGRLGGLRKPSKESTNSGWRHAGLRGYADYMQTPEFETCIDELLALADSTRAVVMCAEAAPRRCHRSLIADALTARGAEVHHILSATQTQPHRMTPFARVANGRVAYPGLLES